MINNNELNSESYFIKNNQLVSPNPNQVQKNDTDQISEKLKSEGLSKDYFYELLKNRVQRFNEEIEDDIDTSDLAHEDDEIPEIFIRNQDIDFLKDLIKNKDNLINTLNSEITKNKQTIYELNQKIILYTEEKRNLQKKIEELKNNKLNGADNKE